MLTAGMMFAAAADVAWAEPALQPALSTRSEEVVKSAHPSAADIRAAAERFSVPERLLRAVMQVESAGDLHAVSSQGAMGLMQIMPATWADLRIKYGLGDDPFWPSDNILAGGAYLREMYERFGSPGFLAAYNAGPQRYQEYLSDGRSLPAETVSYVDKVTSLIDGTAVIPSNIWQTDNRGSADRSPIFVPATSASSVRWRQGERGVNAPGATLFNSSSARGAHSHTVALPDLTAPDAPSVAAPGQTPSALKPVGNSLFVPRSRKESR